MTYDANGLHVETEHLSRFAESTGRTTHVRGYCSARSQARSTLAALRRIRQAHDAAARRYTGADAPPWVRWLLDNWYLAQREGRAAAQELLHAGRLRATEDGKSLLSALCAQLVRAGRGAVTEARCEAFLEGYQNARVLTSRELSLFGAALRAELCLALAAACRQAQAQPEDTTLTAQLAAIFTSLRLLGTCDLGPLLERVNRVDRLLRQDPAGVYPQMDEATRACYRARLTRLAARAGLAEHRVARRVLRLAGETEGRARHVGYYLFVEPLGQKPRQRRGGLYVAAHVVTGLFLALLGGFATGSPLAAVFLLFPVWELVKNGLDFLLLRVTPPAHVPRMALTDGVPDRGRTLCAVSCLLTSEADGPALARRLEEYRLCNRDCGPNLRFALLADLPDTQQAELPEAEAWLNAARAAIERLNERYGGGFYLLTRPRTYCRADGRWMGRERKRGAIMDLAHLLAGQPSELTCLAGEAGALTGTRYILALDADTRLCPGTARPLIGAMLHPLNRPRIDPARRVVVSGYGILAPRIGVELAAARAGAFARVFAGQGGIDPYGSACGEVYMDLFGRGGFAGKGMIDVHALLQCMDGRLPQGRVLSHDALEGAYLRAGFIGDVELTDGFPRRTVSYFRRMHRWTRGDWQNAPWLFGRGRVLAPLERWKLFESLRRSLTPIFALLGLMWGLLRPGPASALTAVVCLLTLASRLLISLTEQMLRPDSGRERHHTGAVWGVRGALAYTGVRLLLLPTEAWILLCAICTALWRQLISHRGLLNWQTAAQADAAAGSRRALFGQMWPAMVLGAVLIIFGAWPGIVLGAAWVLSPPLAEALSAERRDAPPEPGRAERGWLLLRAGELWRFFDQRVGAASHHLPPDNWQEQPPIGEAARTSPTNIGLYLLSILCALDLGLASPERAAKKLEGCLSTLETLPKWHGHLYNWYDTRTCRTLNPPYVSTVDSGNLAACLLCLKHGLGEYGLGEFAARAARLYDAMDFTVLYDKRRRLFHIGYDAQKQALSPSWYDLLSSEARLTAFLTVARGDVPRRHWQALSRAQTSRDGYRGMLSWTGTMFEYLMPELFVPLQPGSLLDEAARFCLYVQRKRTAGPRRVWGISESAYCALDPSLCYRYKAHGCASLALRRGMNDELVISPYSSFLALCVDPEAAVGNLRRLASCGMLGPYGFWEALDFTPRRCRDRRGEPVRCVMAHHAGMSLAAITNRLCDGSVIRRFMAEPCMAAHLPLLSERVPVGAPLMRTRDPDGPPRPPRRAPAPLTRSGEGVDAGRPAVTLLSNGAYHLACAETGLCRVRANGLAVYRDLTLGGTPCVWLQPPEGQAPLHALPFDGAHGSTCTWELSASAARWRVERGPLCTVSSVWVSAREPGEVREVTVSSTTGGSGTLFLCFEPLLAPPADAAGHPAYWRLGLRFELADGVLFVRRLPRGGVSETWLCLACDQPMRVSTERGACGLRASAQTPQAGAGLDPYVCARVSLDLTAGCSAHVRFSLALGNSRQQARTGALRMLSQEPDERAALPAASAALLGMTAPDCAAAMESAARLLFGTGAPRTGPGVPSSALWPLGISGDLPILCARLERQQQLPAAVGLLRRHALLSSCGLPFDLAFITDEGGDYLHPLRDGLCQALRELDREAMLGRRGGIHIVAHSHAQPLLARAAVHVSLDGADAPPPPRDTRLPSRPALPPQAERLTRMPAFRWLDDGSFQFETACALPPRAWQNVLTNGVFGYLAADTGCGAMWYRNARECPVSPWNGDAAALAGPESLTLLTDGADAPLSLFASPDGDCRVTYGFGWARWERRTPAGTVRLSAFVPDEGAARVLLIEPPEGLRARLRWHLPLLLAADVRAAEQVETGFTDGVFQARNPCAPFDVTLRAAASRPPAGWTCRTLSALRGDWDGSAGTGGGPCFAAEWELDGPLALVCAAGDFPPELCTPDGARAALTRTQQQWCARVCRIRVRTPDETVNRLMNGWLPYQAQACRMQARCSLYQCGGAIGFRDQLQDAVNLLPLDPDGTRRHILLCCSRQFSEGDVQHWWHPETGAGVRTRCSDDLLWLPWAVCAYVTATGERALLDEQVPYLDSPPLGEDERERYETPARAGHTASVARHCLDALMCTARRGVGAHGLPLIGTCDWNDGFSAVGAQGRGESVWLAWFYAAVADRMLQLLRDGEGTDHAPGSPLQTARLCRLSAEAACEPAPDAADAAACAAAAAAPPCDTDAVCAQIRDTAEAFTRAAAAAWDTDRYLRAFFDDGEPLGARGCAACAVDAIAQAGPTLCPDAAPPERRRQALDTALRALRDTDTGLVHLFDPPFGPDAQPAPGYITSYGAGFRENGGQYTHGAIWLARALYREGRVQEGFTLLRGLFPPGTDALRYAAEPYVVAADVCTADGHCGSAGWSWYTGSAGWLWRTVLEDVLGLSLSDGRMHIRPHLPDGWDGYDVDVTTPDGRTCHIQVTASGGVTVDGRPADAFPFLRPRDGT